MEYTKELEVAKKIAKLAGEIMLKYFDGEQGVVMKDDKSPVTKADMEINDLVIEELEKIFPEDGIVGEEKSTASYGQGRRWICDPLDGTAGYTWGIPTAMFSLGLAIDGRPVLGVVYDPFLDRLYEGVSEQGSFCNGVKLQVSDNNLEDGKVAVTSNPVKIKNLKYIDEFDNKGTQLRTLNGAVYKSCLVAKGKFEGYVEHGVGPHDMIAVQVIIEEAGGKVTGVKGETLDYSVPFKGAIVSNGKVHNEIVEIVNRDV